MNNQKSPCKVISLDKKYADPGQFLPPYSHLIPDNTYYPVLFDCQLSPIYSCLQAVTTIAYHYSLLPGGGLQLLDSFKSNICSYHFNLHTKLKIEPRFTIFTFISLISYHFQHRYNIVKLPNQSTYSPFPLLTYHPLTFYLPSTHSPNSHQYQ